MLDPKEEYFKKIRDIWVSGDVVANTMATPKLTIKDVKQKLTKPGTKTFIAIKNKDPVGCLRLSLGSSKKKALRRVFCFC